MTTYPKWLAALVFVLLVVHFNYWMWDEATLYLGMPANLFYHVVFSLALSGVMVVVVRRAWPKYLSDD